MKIKDRKIDKDNLFFTSDTHFCHNNIIKYCNRPFANADEMNDELIARWNNIVPKDGVVFHAGDFALGGTPKKIDTLLHSLNGEIFLIKGNHEKAVLRKEYTRSRFSGIYDIAEIFIDDDEITYGTQHIILCHYPMIIWNGSHRGSWHFYGHVHGGLSNKGNTNTSPAQLDIGVDCHNYTPISYQKAKELITQQLLNKNKSFATDDFVKN